MANNLRYDFNMILHKKQVFRYIFKKVFIKIKISVIM